MRSITIWLGNKPPKPPADPKTELGGKQIFASNYCKEHQMGVMLVRPPGGEVDVDCAMSLLEDMARIIADAANVLPEGGVH